MKVAFLARVRLEPLMEFKFFLIGKKMRAFDVHTPVYDIDNTVILCLGSNRAHVSVRSFASARLVVSGIAKVSLSDFVLG